MNLQIMGLAIRNIRLFLTLNVGIKHLVPVMWIVVQTHVEAKLFTIECPTLGVRSVDGEPRWYLERKQPYLKKNQIMSQLLFHYLKIIVALSFSQSVEPI